MTQLKIVIIVMAILSAVGGICPVSADSFIKGYPVGSVYERSVKLPYTTVPLPEGKWKVISGDESVNSNMHTTGDLYLARVEEGKLFGFVWISGNADLVRSGWILDNFCQRKDIILSIVEAYSQYDERCWIVNHMVMTRGPNISNAAAALYSYPEQNHVAMPSTMVVVGMRWHDSSVFTKVYYYFNPEVDGLAPSTQLDWRTNDWHRDRIGSFPDRVAYIEKIKAWGHDEYRLFNLGMHNQLPDQAIPAIPVPPQAAAMPSANASVAERLASIKHLLDQGLITPAEYDKKKAEILGSL